MRGLQVASVEVSANHISAVLRARCATAPRVLWLATLTAVAVGACGGRADEVGASRETGVAANAGTSAQPNAVPSAEGTGQEPSPTPPPPSTGLMDPSCTLSGASQRARCTEDCTVACGFQSMGTMVCTCEYGEYISCPCPRPAEYLGSPNAGPCLSSDGSASELDDTPCDTEWAQCIGTDPVTATTPRGCACLVNRDTGALQWFCGSTNGWFNPVRDPDPSCSAAEARTGSPCTQDCEISCGPDGTGRKYCTCEGGIFAACPCIQSP